MQTNTVIMRARAQNFDTAQWVRNQLEARHLAADVAILETGPHPRAVADCLAWCLYAECDDDNKRGFLRIALVWSVAVNVALLFAIGWSIWVS